MTSVSLLSSTAPLAADAVIVATVSTPAGVALASGAAPVDEALGGVLLAALQAVGATGKPDEVIKIPTLGKSTTPLIVATGLGNGAADTLETESVRRAVGAALRALSHGRVTVAIGDGTDSGLVEAISDGVLLGGYRFTKYKSSSRNAAAGKSTSSKSTSSKSMAGKSIASKSIASNEGVQRVDICVADAADARSRAALRRSKIITTAVNNTRDLVNTPANDLNPVTFAAYAKEQGEAAGLSVEVLDERALKRGGFGGILGVGGGSATPPRLVRLSYQPARAKSSVALIGKGITFDSGGLDLKMVLMAQMKSDMAGAAAVVESVIAAAKLRLPVAVTATVPMAENAVSGTAYRPSDVLVMRDGSTVEVDNTDAEGRLILADAMLRACEDSPDFLIETSTLTGGQMIALGTEMVGAMGSDEFRDRVVAAGTGSGESLWPMPLPPRLRASLDSPVADIVNVSKDRWASMLLAGIFLQNYVPDGLDWVHLDIAGPAFATSAGGYNQRGGTGAIVRTIVATLTDIAQNGS